MSANCPDVKTSTGGGCGGARDKRTKIYRYIENFLKNKYIYSCTNAIAAQAFTARESLYVFRFFLSVCPVSDRIL